MKYTELLEYKIYKVNRSLSNDREDFPVIENPNAEQVKNLIEKSKYKQVRGISFKGNIYVWDADVAIHFVVKTNLRKNHGISFPESYYYDANWSIERYKNEYLFQSHNVPIEEIFREAPRLQIIIDRLNPDIRDPLGSDELPFKKLSLKESRVFEIPSWGGKQTFKVIYAPNFIQIKNILDNSQKGMLRGISSKNKIYVWDGYYGIHSNVKEYLDKDTSNYYEWWIRKHDDGYYFRSYELSKTIFEDSPYLYKVLNKLSNFVIKDYEQPRL